jgi:tetratricopeptide (TPR) repeat protein
MIKLKAMRIFLVIFLSIFPILSSQAGSLVQKEAKVYREEGYRAQSSGDLESALVWYQKAVNLDPSFAQAYNDIGVVYESQGREDEAMGMYGKALEIDPGYLPVYTNLAFLSEKKGNIEEAASYWQKRYELGQEGDYWWEVSRQHLLKLGKYPKLRRERLEKEAAALSKKIIDKNEQDRLKAISEARFHFNLGNQAFIEKDYAGAIKELETVFFLDPPDREFLDKSAKLYRQSKRLFLKKQVVSEAKNALDYIENDDYLSAQRKLTDTLETISRITQEE